MANILDRFFDEALRHIPSESSLSNQILPRPGNPEHAESDFYEIKEDANDVLIPINDRLVQRKVLWRLSDSQETPFPLDEKKRALLDGGVREAGFDVYAFYKSRRQIHNSPYPGKWGIFYLEHGVARIQELIEATYPGYGSSFKLAYEFLRRHERFHFKFDIYALMMESAQGRSLYEPLKKAFRHHRISSVEEALANLDAWEWAKQDHIGLEEFAYDFMKLQPGAYARFDEKRHNLTGELASNLLDLDMSRSSRRDDQGLWVGIVPNELLRPSLCPEYFVRPVTLSSWISPAWKLPKIVKVTETESVTKLLTFKYSSMRDRWEDTKKKLIQNPALPGLDFKPWDKANKLWSVRVNENFRAHLRPLQNSIGVWEADKFGPHMAMGHG